MKLKNVKIYEERKHECLMELSFKKDVNAKDYVISISPF